MIEFDGAPGPENPVARWCMHPYEHRITMAPKILWCKRCGGIWSGAMRKSGGKRWEVPQIANYYRIP